MSFNFGLNIASFTRHFMVYKLWLVPSTVSPPHTHTPTVLNSLAKLRFTVRSGDETWMFDFYPSLVYWIGHFQHSWEIFAGDAHLFRIEIKTAHRNAK
jgi:hypothetical protein